MTTGRDLAYQFAKRRVDSCYARFLDYGEAADYQAKLKEFRVALAPEEQDKPVK